MFSLLPSKQEPTAVPRAGAGYAWPNFGTRLVRVFDSRKARRSAAPNERIETVIEDVLSKDAGYRRKSTRILLYQERLRGQVSGRAWKLYLLLEEAEFERWTYALDRLAEWAIKFRRPSLTRRTARLPGKRRT